MLILANFFLYPVLFVLLTTIFLFLLLQLTTTFLKFTQLCGSIQFILLRFIQIAVFILYVLGIKVDVLFWSFFYFFFLFLRLFFCFLFVWIQLFRLRFFYDVLCFLLRCFLFFVYRILLPVLFPGLLLLLLEVHYPGIDILPLRFQFRICILFGRLCSLVGIIQDDRFMFIHIRFDLRIDLLVRFGIIGFRVIDFIFLSSFWHNESP